MALNKVLGLIETRCDWSHINRRAAIYEMKKGKTFADTIRAQVPSAETRAPKLLLTLMPLY